jgi:hypothetical protein
VRCTVRPRIRPSAGTRAPQYIDGDGVRTCRRGGREGSNKKAARKQQRIQRFPAAGLALGAQAGVGWRELLRAGVEFEAEQADRQRCAAVPWCSSRGGPLAVPPVAQRQRSHRSPPARPPAPSPSHSQRAPPRACQSSGRRRETGELGLHDAANRRGAGRALLHGWSDPGSSAGRPCTHSEPGAVRAPLAWHLRCVQIADPR